METSLSVKTLNIGKIPISSCFNQKLSMLRLYLPNVLFNFLCFINVISTPEMTGLLSALKKLIFLLISSMFQASPFTVTFWQLCLTESFNV